MYGDDDYGRGPQINAKIVILGSSGIYLSISLSLYLSIYLFIFIHICNFFYLHTIFLLLNILIVILFLI